MSIVRRVRRDGSVGYQVRVSVAGRRLPAETFDTHREARRREAELVTKRRHASTDETCDHFADRWLRGLPDREVRTDPWSAPVRAHHRLLHRAAAPVRR